MKSAIIRCAESVCLHGKQTTGKGIKNACRSGWNAVKSGFNKVRGNKGIKYTLKKSVICVNSVVTNYIVVILY